jgi:hypothetical protein
MLAWGEDLIIIPLKENEKRRRIAGEISFIYPGNAA